MYQLTISFKTEVRHATDDVDRIFFLVQEWIKQPRTRRVTVKNPEGRTVFYWER
jgi:hypothetical protein